MGCGAALGAKNSKERTALETAQKVGEEEAATVLFALDDAAEVTRDNDQRRRLEGAAQIIIDKLLPDLKDL